MFPVRIKSKNIPAILINGYAIPIIPKIVTPESQIRWEHVALVIVGTELAVVSLGDLEVLPLEPEKEAEDKELDA